MKSRQAHKIQKTTQETTQKTTQDTTQETTEETRQCTCNDDILKRLKVVVTENLTNRFEMHLDESAFSRLLKQIHSQRLYFKTFYHSLSRSLITRPARTQSETYASPQDFFDRKRWRNMFMTGDNF